MINMQRPAIVAPARDEAERHAATLPPSAHPYLSIILPVFNEEACIGATLEELFGALEKLGHSFEVIAVNDGSVDRSLGILRACRLRQPRLRIISLARNKGQSAAFGVGFQKSRGDVTVLMDGDGQNDPRDIGILLEALEHADVCCGIRARRKDTFARRVASQLANRIRSSILDDGIVDTGCSLKAIRTEWLKGLPMQLAGMHRFLPALLQMKGARVVQIPVNHRPRSAGHSKYTNLGRLRVTIVDLFAVRWMQRRHRNYAFSEEL